MKQYIGCDAHQRYSVFVTVDETGRAGQAMRVGNDWAGLRRFLRKLPTGAPVAVEASGGWYWLIDELEAAGLEPHLANPKEAKQRMRGRNKTDKLDATGLAILLRYGTLPEVWIPDAPLRDLPGLLRTRLAMRRQTTFLKNRISAAIRRYGLREEGCSDLFAGKGRVQLSYYIGWLPEHTRHAAIQEWELLDEVEARMEILERRIRERIGSIGYTRLLKTLPGVGEILGATLYLEIGDAQRFPTAAHLASYAGLVPTVHASGGKTWMGHTPPTANHFLKWAFIEAANCVVRHQKKYALAHVARLYQRLKPEKGHAKAAVAVARHLAEASWWMLTKHQIYREPAPATITSSKNG